MKGEDPSAFSRSGHACQPYNARMPIKLEKAERLATLKKVSFFSHLEDEALRSLAETAIPKSWSKGEIIFSEGTPCPGLFVVHSGAVKIFKTSVKGREQVLTIETAGRAVAELAVLDEGPYPASAMAMEETTVLLILKQDFHNLCRRHPEIGFRIIKALAGRFRKLVGLVEALAFLEVGQRLAKFLFERASQHPKRGNEQVEFTLDQSHQELAAQIGTVRELVSRSFGRFQEQEILSVKNRTITILNMDRLKEEADVE
jgi:CRP/FNR family cyclic AMP-dependent transcriptional regulator